MIGKGLLIRVDSILCQLCFASTKQAHAVWEGAEPPVSGEDRAKRLKTITDESKQLTAGPVLDGKWLVAQSSTAMATAAAGGDRKRQGQPGIVTRQVDIRVLDD